jgi:hypothetical protein
VIPNADPRHGEAVKLALTRLLVVGGPVELDVAALLDPPTVTLDP